MAIVFFAAALAADSRIAAEPDLRWQGAWASGLDLPLARTTRRGARVARRARFGARHKRGGRGRLGRTASAAGIDRAACRRWACPDFAVVACATPGACPRDRP